MTNNATDVVQHAEALARRGEIGAAQTLLEGAGHNGDAIACFTLGRWYLSGAHLQRSLEQSRDWFAGAAALGHGEARRILSAFLATGTGGAPDWPAALALLAEVEPPAQRELALIEAMPLTPDGEPAGIYPGEIISEQPHLTVFKELLSPAECAFLIDAASSRFAPSVVVDPATGHLIQHQIRTSDVAAFPLVAEGPAISAINRRIARCSGTSASQGEPLQILRYRQGQQYRPHFDGIAGARNQRSLTTLVYLNDDYDGGETVFLRGGVTFRGRPGDALLFRNTRDGVSIDEMSLHAGLPVARGTKFLASRWIRAQPIDLSAPMSLA